MDWKIQKLKPWRGVMFASLAIFLLAFLLRSAHLNSLPVFADEAIYVRWAQVMKAEPTLRFLPLSDGKQPLFMWSVIPSLELFSDPLIAGRAVSVLTGIMSMAGIFALSYLLFKNKKVSLLAMLMYAVSPYAVFFDRMALVDSMLSMFGIWMFVFGLLSMRYMRWDMAIMAGFSLGGAALTKSPAIFLGLLFPLTAMFAKKRDFLRIGFYIATTWVLAFGMYNILRLGPNFHLLSSRTADYVYPFSHVLESPLNPLLPFLSDAIRWYVSLGPVLVIAMALLGVAICVKKYPKEVFFLSTWAVLPVLVQAEFAHTFTARYIFFTVPPVLILASLALFPALGKAKSIIKYSIYVLILAFVCHSLYVNHQVINSPENAPLPKGERAGYLEEWTAGTGIKEASEHIKSEAMADPTPILVGAEGYFGTPFDGFQFYLNGVPNVTVIGTDIDLNEVPESLTDSRDSGNKTYLAINSSRLKFEEDEFDDMGLEIVLSFKKAERPEMTRAHVQHGPYDTFYLLKLK